MSCAPGLALGLRVGGLLRQVAAESLGQEVGTDKADDRGNGDVAGDRPCAKLDIRDGDDRDVACRISWGLSLSFPTKPGVLAC